MLTGPDPTRPSTEREFGPDRVRSSPTMHLTVGFLEVALELTPGRSLGFGAAADIVLDEGNADLAGHAGRFTSGSGLWWLQNTGSSRLTVIGTDMGYDLPPMRCGPLWFGPCLVRITAGRAVYELQCTATPAHPPLPRSASNSQSVDGAPDRTRWTSDQLRLIVCLSERHLIDPTLRYSSGWQVPPNREAAARLGWSETAFNRKLDRICARLDQEGVAGLRREGSHAADRRARLVSYAVDSGLVSAADLELIEPGGVATGMGAGCRRGGVEVRCSDGG